MQKFFIEVALPIIKRNFPNLHYSAGILGYGSDVLGYDDFISTDHMWGPRFYIFLDEDEIVFNNIASAKVILKNGVVFEDVREYNGHTIKRYWITIKNN